MIEQFVNNNIEIVATIAGIIAIISLVFIYKLK